MPAIDERKDPESEMGAAVHESETVVPSMGSDGGGSSATDAVAPPQDRFADLGEFARQLIELGLIDEAELQAFADDSAQGVLGLSRALVNAGKLTAYQAAAVYQKKGRGLLIGNYLILDKLGQGGMGMVFKARHRRLGKLGALKILPPSFARDPTAVQRFRREIQAAGRLQHPNLVAAQDADEDRGVHFLVMNYVDGRDLDRIVHESGPLPVAQAVDCLIQAARGLEAAHAQGIIHRDIKPGNLMLAAGTVRVLDLGLARIVDATNPFSKSAAGRLTQSGMYMGTIDYMAPEQAEDSHRVDHRADIYSLGCTLHYLLTGREPFPAETVLKRLVAHMERTPPALSVARPEVPPALDAAYHKMMAKRPEDRPASMIEVVALLEACKEAAAQADRAPAKAPRSQPELKVFNEPLKGGGPPTTRSGPSVGARPKPAAATGVNNELSLADLAMDVRSEASPPPPLPPSPRTSPARGQRPKRMAATGTRGRGRNSPIFVAVGAVAVLVSGIVGFALLAGRGRGPEVTPPALPSETQSVQDQRVEKPTEPSPSQLPRDLATVTEPPTPANSGPSQEHRDPMPPTRPPDQPKTEVGKLIAKAGPTKTVGGRSRQADRPAASPPAPPEVKILRPALPALTRLQQPIPMRFPNATPLTDVLRYIKKATKKGTDDPGLAIYLDPLGFQEAEKTFMSTVMIDVDGIPLETTLAEILKQLGLAYVVKDGALFVSSRNGVERERRKPEKEIRAFDATPKTKAVLARLELPVSMPFVNETPLDRVLAHITRATTSPTHTGIPIYVEQRGLQVVERNMLSTVWIDLDGVPLRTSLRWTLDQLGLIYVVKDGMLHITARELVNGPAGRARRTR
jgi:serine/threonine protein kinase